MIHPHLANMRQHGKAARKGHTRVPLPHQLTAVVKVVLVICKAVVCLTVGVCPVSFKKWTIELYINPCPRVYSTVAVLGHTVCQP